MYTYVVFQYVDNGCPALNIVHLREEAAQQKFLEGCIHYSTHNFWNAAWFAYCDFYRCLTPFSFLNYVQTNNSNSCEHTEEIQQTPA